MAKGWIYTADGRVFEKGSPEHYERMAGTSGVAFVPDDVEFVSPIDQKVYSGRTGMREHNARHGVVSNRDLTGLPPQLTHTEYKPDRAAIRGELIKAARSKGLM